VALLVQQGFATDITDLGELELDLASLVLPVDEAGDVVELTGEVDRDALIPGGR
jgi:hypothetical protein